MPPTPMPPEKETEIKNLAQSIREAIDAEISELATSLASTDDAHLGSGAVESACKTVVGQRLKLAGMRWGEDGAHALCPSALCTAARRVSGTPSGPVITPPTDRLYHQLT